MKRTCFGFVFAAMMTFVAFGCGDAEDAPAAGSVAGADTTTAPADGDDDVHAMAYCGHCGQEKGSQECCVKDAEKCDCGMAKGSPLCCKDLGEDAKGKDICSGCGHAVGEDEHHHCDEKCEKCDKCGMHAGAPACCKDITATAKAE